MSDGSIEYTLAWIRKAESDLRNVANNLQVGGDDLPTDTLAFHCQQAVEKYLKAYLVSKDVSYPFTHDLALLIRKCSDLEPEFMEIMEAAESLTPFAVEARYPDDLTLPALEDVIGYQNSVLMIKKFVIERLPAEIQSRIN